MKALLVLVAILALTSANISFLADLIEPEPCPICCQTLSERPSMNYTFYINTGHFVGGSGKYAIDTYGYSGNGDGYLNPNATCEKSVGPLPVNVYNLTLCKDLMHTNVTRPCSFYLNPIDTSVMCGRDSFFIHGCQCCTPGDYTIPPTGGCSEGCVVIQHAERVKLRVGDYIHVVAYEHRRDTLNF